MTATRELPGEQTRELTLTANFSAADWAVYTALGTKGLLRMKQAYEYSEAIEMEITVGGRTTRCEYKIRDQFAPELLYFSDCFLRNKTPEPSGIEGLADVRIIRSLYDGKQSSALRHFRNSRR